MFKSFAFTEGILLRSAATNVESVMPAFWQSMTSQISMTSFTTFRLPSPLAFWRRFLNSRIASERPSLSHSSMSKSLAFVDSSRE